MGFPGGPVGKESAWNTGDPGLIPELGKSPGEGNGCLLQFSCLENFHGQRSWAGYSSWSHKGLDTTELLSSFSHIIYNWVCVVICIHLGYII